MLVSVVLGLVLTCSVGGSRVCNTFKDTEIQIEIHKTSISKLVNISGCVERIQAGFNGETVEKILVKDQRLVRLNKDSVRNMVRLRKIKFENCEIGEIDAEAFRNLPRIKEIRVVRNKVRRIEGGTFGRGMPLEVLDLSANLLAELERFEVVGSLRSLNLRSNLLENLPEDLLANCANLEEINLAWNKLSAIPNNLFANTQKLRHVDLRSNKLSTLNLQLQNLENLLLSKNFLTSISLPNPLTLNKLDLAANFLNSLPISFMQNLNVKSLFLTGNPLLCNCLAPIEAMLLKTGGELKNLKGCEEFPVCVSSNASREDCGTGAVDTEATKKFLANVTHYRQDMEHCYNYNLQ